MNREELLKYLTDNGCVLVRNANQGYSVVRNVISGKISGIPKDQYILPAAVCRICKTLSIESPDGVKAAQAVVDLAHKNHGLKDQ